MRALVVTVWLVLASGCTLRGTDYLQSGIGCTAPLADCDGDGSCESNLADTAAHCGACGYACDGIGCEQGSCLLDTLEDMVVLQIDIDDQHAYLTCSPPRLAYVPLNGGGPWDNFHVQIATNFFGVYVDDGSVWWVSQAFDAMNQQFPALFRKPRGAAGADAEEKWRGATPTVVRAGSVTGSGVTIAWSYGTEPVISEVEGAFKTELPLSRGIATGEPNAIGLSTNPQFDVLWTNLGGELTHWRPGATVDVTTARERPFDVVLADLDEAYFVEWGAQETPAAPNGRLSRVRWDVPPQGAVPAEDLVTDLAEPVALVLDNTHVYFSESSIESDVPGSIKRFDRAAATVETLARAESHTDVVGDLDMHGETLAWVVAREGEPLVIEVWKRSKNAYVLPP